MELDFNARFSAKQRYHVYKIINLPSINIITGLQYWVKNPLDLELMREAASYLLGKHDFSSFRAAQCQSSSPVKIISNIDIIREGENIEIYVSAIHFFTIWYGI